MSRLERLLSQLAVAGLGACAVAASAAAEPATTTMAWHTEPEALAWHTEPEALAWHTEPEALAWHTEPEAPSVVPGDDGCTPAGPELQPSAWHTQPEMPAAVQPDENGTCTDVPRRKIGP